MSIILNVSFFVYLQNANAKNINFNKNSNLLVGRNVDVRKPAKTKVASGIIVKFKNKLKLDAKGNVDPKNTGISSINSKNKVEKIQVIEPISKGKKNFQDKPAKNLEKVYRLKVSKGSDIKSLVQKYKQDSNVEYVQPDYLLQPTIVPNDTQYANLWGLAKINAASAWDAHNDSSAITVAVIDTGTNYNHEDLAANIWNNLGETGLTQAGEICWTGVPENKSTNDCDDDENSYVDDWRGWNYVDDNNDPMDLGFEGIYHGSHVSGIISGVGNNNKGVVGVNWNAKIMPLRICDTSNGCWTSYAASAITYAAENGAKVINNSWGGEVVEDPVVKDAIDYAHSLGVVVINAAGNESSDVYSFSPANINTAMAISATDSSDNMAYFTNWGSKVDVSAPGVNILSTWNANNYQSESGTSMAAPYAAGLAALVLANDQTLDNEEVRQILKSSSNDKGNVGWDGVFGAGRINASNALAASRPPRVYIDSPATAGPGLNGNVPIIGTADGVNFQSYKIEYGSGTLPSSWTQINSSSTPVTNNTLGTLDMQQLTSGTYVMRLTVTDTQNKSYEFRSYFDVLTNPSVPQSFEFSNANNTISLSWQPSIAQHPIAGYEIYKSENADFSSPTIITTANTYFDDTDLQIGHAYYYKLRAYDNQATKNYSEFTDFLLVVNNNPWWMHQISSASESVQKTGYTNYVSIPSDNGRYVAFSDDSSDLVNGDTNNASDIFVKDISTDITTRVSVSSEGIEGNCDSNYPAMSADGRYIVFQSCASNLVANDTNEKPDIFVRDTQLNTTALVSSDTGGVQNPAWTGGDFPAISADGRYVTFTAFENNGKDNIYRKDLQTGMTTLVSASATGTAGNYPSFDSGISANGQYVVFDTQATNLTSDGIGGTYLKNMQTNEIEYISVGNDSGLWIGFDVAPRVSENGRYVVFQSGATNLVDGMTTDGRNNLYLRDRQTDTTELITKAFSGGDYNGYGAYGGNISADGHYIAFYSDGSDLIANDTNDRWDAFVYDRNSGEMSLVSRDLYGSETVTGSVIYSSQLSNNGKFITFVSDAQFLLPSVNNENSLTQAYIRTTDGAPGPLNHIDIDPATSQTIDLGKTLQFTAQGKDEYGTNVPNLDYSWQDADQNGLFRASSVSDFLVSASSQGISSESVNVTVNSIPIDHIEIFPNIPRTITAGETIQFTAVAKDNNGDVISNIVFDWIWADQSGLFNLTNAGDFYVQALLDGVESPQVMVTVLPDVTAAVDMYPDTDQIINIGATIPFIAQGLDQYGNIVENSEITWEGTDENGLFTGSAPGNYQVKVTVDGIERIINITVKNFPPDAPSGLNVT